MKTSSEKSIFTNNILLNLRDHIIKKKYNLTKHIFKKFLLYFFFSFCFILLNYILSTNILKNEFKNNSNQNQVEINDKNQSQKVILNNNTQNFNYFNVMDSTNSYNPYFLTEEQNIYILKINFALIIIFGIILLMLVLLNLGNKKFNFFYFIISWFYSFNNSLQFQTLRALLYNRVNPTHLYYSIPYSHAAIVIFYIIFMDSSFVINSTAFIFNLAFMLIFSIGNNWSQPFELSILIGSGIFFGYYNYLYDKNEKQSFFMKTKLEASLEKSKFLLQHLNLGFINIKKNLNFEYNSKMLDILEKCFNLKFENNIIVLAIKVLLFSNISEFNKQIKGLNDLIKETESFMKDFALSFLNNLKENEFQKLLEANTNLPNFIEDFKGIANKLINEKSLIKEYEKLLEKNFDKFIKILFDNLRVNNFVYLWKLKNNYFPDKPIYNIFVRYNKSNESLEFLLSDAINHVKSEENQFSDNFIKRFLENLLTQLKGPIKQINDSVDLIFESNNNSLENNNLNNAYNVNKYYNNAQINPISSNNINYIAGNLNLIDFAGKISHLKNLKLLAIYIDYYLFKFTNSFNDSNRLTLKYNYNYYQEDDCLIKDNTNKFNKINIQRNNFSERSISKNNIIFNNKKSSKIFMNNNIKTNEVFNKANNNRNYSKMNSKNFYNINLVRKNTPGINNMEDLSNSDVNFLLNENNKKTSNENILTNQMVNLNLNFINGIPKKEEEILEKNVEENNRHQPKQTTNHKTQGNFIAEGYLNKLLKKKGLENSDFHLISNILFQNILVSINKTPSSYNKDNLNGALKFQKNDNHLIEFDIDNYSDNRSIKEIIKPQKSLGFKSYNNNKEKIKYNNTNKEYNNNLNFNRNNISSGPNDSNWKQYIDNFQYKDPVIRKSSISSLTNIQISIETVMKSYIKYFEVSNRSHSKFINYKFILNPNLEMNRNQIKLKNHNEVSITNKNINKNPYNKSINNGNEKKAEIYLCSENAKYYLFYVFFYLNNFLRSGFIVFKTISLLEEDQIRINIDIRGIREYEIENISPDRVSNFTYKEMNNNVRNNVLENFNNNNNFKKKKKNSNHKIQEDPTPIKATALFNINMNLQNENNLENSNNNNNILSDVKTLNLSDYKSLKTIDNNYNNQNTNKQDVNPVQKQSNNILSINFNANKNGNNNNAGNNSNNPNENHYVNNKFSFSNLADKNFGDLNISNVNKNSENISNNLSNNFIMYPLINNDNNSFITKNIFNQSSFLENKGDNNNITENPKSNNINNTPYTSNYLNNENNNNNSERNKENDLIYFESLKNCLKEIGGNLIISMKENQVFCLTIDLPKNHKCKSSNVNEPFVDVNNLNQRNNLNNINNIFYINKINFNNNKNSNATLNNIFNYLVNSNKELLKKTSTGNSNNFILNKQRMFSKVSTENMGFNNLNNPKSYFSQDFLEELLFRQNTFENNFFNQNILNNNYINNYNIINTFSEPNLIKSKTNRRRGFLRLQTHKTKKRSFSNIEREKDINLAKQLMIERFEDQNLNCDLKGDLLALRKCNSEKFDDLFHSKKKNYINNEDLYGNGMDNKHNLHSLFFKQYNFDLNNKKLFRNKTCNKEFLSRSKNNSIIKNEKNNNDTIKKFERIFTRKESFSPDNENDFIQRKILNIKNNLKADPLDSYEDSSNSDSSYIYNLSDQSKRFAIKGDLIKNSNRFKSNFPKNNGLIGNTFDSNKYAKCNKKKEESDLGNKSLNMNSSSNNNPEKLNLMKNKIYYQEKANLLSEIHEYENYEDCSAFQDKSIINKNISALTLKKNAKLKILMVEDDKFIRQCQVNLIKRYFNYDSDIFIDECEDGIECLYKIYLAKKIGEKYDLVITDEKMQYIDGLYLASILKTLKEKNLIYELKVFLVTFNESAIFNNSQLEINKAYLNLFIEVLPKPLELRFLKNIFKLFGY